MHGGCRKGASWSQLPSLDTAWTTLMYERSYTCRSSTACWITIRSFSKRARWWEMPECIWMERNKTNTMTPSILWQMIWRYGLTAPIDAKGLTWVCSSMEKQQHAHFFPELFFVIIVWSKWSKHNWELPPPSPRSHFMLQGQLVFWLWLSAFLCLSSVATHQ